MIDYLSEKICDQFIKDHIIQEEEKELYEYGLHYGMVMILNIITMMITGAILGLLWQSVIFMLFFYPLRIYAGGYHAQTQIRCYVISTIINFCALCLIKFITMNNIMHLIIVVITFLCIFLLAPVESENKPLNTAEIHAYKRIVRYIWLAEFVLLSVSNFLKLEQLEMTILMSFVLVNLLLIMGQISKVLGK